MLVDLRNLNVTGKQMENLLDEVNITCNKNAIPNDPQSPFVTSGVRLGTPAVTSRGMKPEDMDRIAEAIALVLTQKDRQEEAKAIVKRADRKISPCRINRDCGKQRLLRQPLFDFCGETCYDILQIYVVENEDFMKILLAACNAKYIHSNLAVYNLMAYAKSTKTFWYCGNLPSTSPEMRL